jgi:hypothetical protein
MMLTFFFFFFFFFFLSKEDFIEGKPHNCGIQFLLQQLTDNQFISTITDTLISTITFFYNLPK